VGEDSTAPQSGNKVSVYEAASALGVTVDAIRKRVARGTIPHERDEDGRVWVILDTDQHVASKVQDTDQPQFDTATLISEMRGRIEDLRQQLEAERQGHAEARRLLAAALERIPPQLEAPERGQKAQRKPRAPVLEKDPSPKRRGRRGSLG
jgi:hypothetical protein